MARTFEIAPGVHRVALLGTNAYFVRSGGSCALIDAGYPGSATAITQAARQVCGETGRPDVILLTHGHPDHAGAAVELATKWSAPIQISSADLPYVNGTALYPEPFVAFLKRVLSARAMASLVRGSNLGERVQPFDLTGPVPFLPDWSVVPTPGHTPGHVAFFRPADRTLICGDAVITLPWHSRLRAGGCWLWDRLRGKAHLWGPPSAFTCSWKEAASSIVRVAALEPRVLASGHGAPLIGTEVAPMLRAFATRVAAQDLPF